MSRALPILAFLSLAGVGAITPGCATLTQSGTQKIVFRAMNVEGVSCRITTDDGEKWLLTSLPAAIVVERRKRPLQVSCKKPGFKRYKFNIEPRFEGEVEKNLLLGLGVTPIFIAVDVFMGKHWHFPANISMHMEPTRMNAKERLKWLRALGLEDGILHCQRVSCPPELLVKLMEPESPVPVIVPPEKPETEEKPPVRIEMDEASPEESPSLTPTSAATPTASATPTAGVAPVPPGEEAPALPRPDVATSGSDTPPPRIAVRPGFPETGKGDYLVLAGSYLRREDVRKIFVMLMENKIPAHLHEPDESNSPYTHIRIGPFQTKEDTERAVAIIREKVDIPLETLPPKP